ncbi:MAG: GTP 3',8-cyclase MoaA [Termitinemataceae bacterium]|nr:MAG: GTP 3',8-cyclase MoaA [Termitinemataceae bacterium]
MIDAFGRTIDYLRVGVTDRCNLRCIYCMPSNGVEWLFHDEVLSFEEILHICTVAAGMGISKIKVTGGEPLVRRGIIPFIAALKKISGIKTVSITTNALLLGEYLDQLLDAGLDAINISLDTLDEKTFLRITNNSDLVQVLGAIKKVLKTNLNIKINCVPLLGVNENDIIPLAAFAKDYNIAVRFIELMPLGFAACHKAIPFDSVFSTLKNHFGALCESQESRGNGPAKYFTVEGFKGSIGFISALSHNFCSTCNRMRLIGTGLLKPCLSSDISLDLKSILRKKIIPGLSVDDALKNAFESALILKPPSHTFAESVKSTNMFRIGG